MRLKFENNKIRCRISKIEAVELLKMGFLADKVNFPSGHIFTFRVEATALSENETKYANSTLTFLITRDTVERLATQPTKEGVTFLQDKAAYGFEIDVRQERRKRIRKI